MGNKLNSGLLKKTITYAVLICRLLVLSLLFIFETNGWLTETELHQLLCIILPISVLYGVFVIKFAFIRKRYFAAGNSISKGYFLWSCAPLILLHLLELTLILFKIAIYGDNVGALYWWVAIIESVFGGYAGFYLSDLFSNNTNSTETKTPEK